MKLMKRFFLNRPAEKRLAYFYGMVATDEQVWLLRDKNDDLLLFEDEDGFHFYYLFGQLEALLKWWLPILMSHSKRSTCHLRIF